MWPFRKKSVATEAPADPTLVAIVDDYLSSIPEDGGWDDEEVFQDLVALGHDAEAAWFVVGLIPIFAGRHVMRDLGPRFSDRVDIYSDGGIKESHMLDTYPPYAATRSRGARILRHSNVKALALWGAEFNAVNELMNQGSDPRDLVLTSVALLSRQLPRHSTERR